MDKFCFNAERAKSVNYQVLQMNKSIIEFDP